jgi:hypothetical protein
MTLTKIPLKSGANQLGAPASLATWGGVVSDFPAPGALAVFDDMRNFLCRKGRIITRPRLNAFGAPPDGARVRYLGTFQDITNQYHTLVLTTKNAYMITNGPVYNLLGYPGGVTTLDGTTLPFSTAQILNSLYFANGSQPLMYSDGSAVLQVAGDIQGSCQFLTTNAQALIMAVTTEPAPGNVNSTVFPRRVRWSASGLPNEWVTATDPSAGFNDLVEVPDIISGLTTLGRNTYVFRTNGITVMYPTAATGLGTLAFAFEDFSFAPLGVGNLFYLFDGSTPQPIGYSNKKRIYKDLAAASGDQVVGGILPVLGPNFDFLAYYLEIPGPNVTWVFGYDEKNWMRIDSGAGFLSAMNFVGVA